MKNKYGKRMKIIIFGLVILIFCAANSSGECYNVTTDVLYVNNDTILCTGVYNNASVVINSSDIVFDCNGSTLNGNGSGSGIYLDNKNNVTIKNCNVMNYDKGIYLSHSTNNTLTNISINSNNFGIDLYFSSNNIMINNNANSNNKNGIGLEDSSNYNILINNTANDNNFGIRVGSSSNNAINNNTANNNTNAGIHLSSSSNNAVTKNNANSNDHDGISLSSSSNNNITNNTLNGNNRYGINLWQSSDNLIANNTILGEVQIYANPIIAFIDPTPDDGSVVYGNKVDIKITSNQYISKIVLEWNGTTNRTMCESDNNWTTYIRDIKTGTYSYKAYVYICNELVKITDERIVVINDTVPPEITIYPCNYSQKPFIGFNTDENSNYTLNYGINNTLNNTISSSLMTRYHDVLLPSAANGTVYYYQIIYCDVSGNCNVSEIKNMTLGTDYYCYHPHIPGSGCSAPSGRTGINIRYSSSNNTLINNHISETCIGASFSGASAFCRVAYNRIIDNYDNGIYFDPSTTNNTLISNLIYGNDMDVKNEGVNSGENNTCDTGNWNDFGIVGCWYTSSGLLRVCDLNHDGIIIHDYNDLMTAYKCFLGIQNCNDYYQNWHLMKQEYECFVNAQQI